MDTIQLMQGASKLLEDYPNFNFLGVYAADDIPVDCENLTYPFGIIVNTDPSNEPGTHWVAFYFHNASMYEFFDSFALPIDMYPYIFNTVKSLSCIGSCLFPIQSLHSNKCGHFCIFFILSLAKGYNFHSILGNFSDSDLGSNDLFVSIFDQFSDSTFPTGQIRNSQLNQICKCRKFFK